MDNNDKIVYDKLKQLSQSCGMLVFQIDDFYVQFAKEKRDSQTILCEAVSHHFLKSLSEKLENEFVAIGFQLDKENYYKHIGTGNIEITVKEVRRIFEILYKASYDKPFDIIEEIE